MSLYQTSSPLY